MENNIPEQTEVALRSALELIRNLTKAECAVVLVKVDEQRYMQCGGTDAQGARLLLEAAGRVLYKALEASKEAAK